MHVHDQDRLVRLPWLGEGIQIREIQARVSVRETEVGTGVMVRHASPQRRSPRPSTSRCQSCLVFEPEGFRSSFSCLSASASSGLTVWVLQRGSVLCKAPLNRNWSATVVHFAHEIPLRTRLNVATKAVSSKPIDHFGKSPFSDFRSILGNV